MQPIDVSPANLDTVRQILREHVPELEVRAFGSRVDWTARETSDLDLVLMTAAPLDIGRLAALRTAYTASNLPFRADIVDWASTSESFRKLIERDYMVVQHGNGTKGASTSGEWRDVTIGELIDIKHGFAFKGHSIHDDPQGDVLLTPGNFAIGGGFKGDRFKYYDGSVPEDFVLSGGDLLVTMTDLSKQSDTLGYPAFVPANTDGRRYLHNQRLGKIIPKGNGEICTRYVYYVMCSAEYRNEVLASATGTTVKHTSPDRIKQHRFKLPPLSEQRVIAHVLGTLDRKIELNRRMNETLEDVARALFRSWFVDFDPVRAQMEGRDTGLPKEIANLFPSRMVGSELGNIPEGWTVSALGECFDLTMGQSPPSSTYNEHGEGMPFFQGRTDFGFRYPKNRRYCTSPTRIAQADDTLVSVRAPVGDINRSWERCCVGRGVAGLRHKSGLSSYTYYAVEAIRLEIQQYEHTGTVFGAITKKQFAALQLIEPPREIMELFEMHVMQTDGRIRTSTVETRTLSALRDTLLPKLVSGELRVNARKPDRRREDRPALVDAHGA